MLTGDSAGGLGVLHAADSVGAFLKHESPQLQSYKAVPVSGFFLDHDDVDGVPQYANALRAAFSFHNASAGVSVGCLAAPPRPADPSSCFFAQNALVRINSTPTFVLNSALDQFQTLCILAGKVKSSGCSGIDGWEACRTNLTDCSDVQMNIMVQYEKDFLRLFAASFAAANGSGSGVAGRHGAFIYSCHNHCAGDSVLYNRITVANKTMMQAVEEWWHGGSSNAVGPNGGIKHTAQLDTAYAAPCVWHTAEGHRKCNPTCYKND